MGAVHRAEVAVTHPREPHEARMVAALTEAMREKLTQRRHHGDWRDMPIHDLRDWLTDEVGELINAVCDCQCYPTGENLAALRAECADVACLAGMILDCMSRESDVA